MDLSRPHGVLGPTVDFDVLRVVAGTTEPLSARRIWTLIGHASESGVRLAAQRLAEQGVLHTRRAGNAVLYSLNRDHLAADAVLQLAGVREELLRRLRAELASWTPPPLAAALFGSAARSDGHTDSDIDIVLVRPDRVDADDETWHAELDRLHELVRAWTGNALGLFDTSASELAAIDPAFRAELRADAVDLGHTSIRPLLGRD